MFSFGYFMVGIKMNDRIRQLAEQAGFEITPWGNESVPCVHQEGPIDVELEKFLELIVRECGNIAFEHWALTHETSPQEAILKHFGVEE
jgi:hypothetical protein